MTTTLTTTFNRDDIRRVYASFAADYRMVAEWTELHTPSYVAKTTEEIKALAEAEYLREVHLQLRTSNGVLREAAVYRISTNASGWTSDRPGDLYWSHQPSDYLQLIVFYTQKWLDLTLAERNAWKAAHMPGWVSSDFDGNYGMMLSKNDRNYASRAYGMERTRYSA